MQSDSATESDPDSFTEAYEPNLVSLPDFQEEHALHYEDLREATLHALEQIKQFDLTAVQRDTSLHQEILNASNIVLRFLDRSCSPAHTDRVAEALSVFPCLVDIEFLSILFHHRKVSRTIAAQAAIHNPVATVVCWVDVVLAKLSALILTVASGFSPHPLPPYSKFIQSQREEDDVRAATQLPEKWQSIVDVIASNKRSPAAMRLATRLIFAAYVMGPQLNAHEDWIDPDVQPEVVMAAILRNAKHRPMNGFSSISSTLRHDMEERANHAMIVSIYSASQGAKGRCQASKPLSPMRIHGLSYLLTILQLALHGNVGSCGQTVLLYEDLNLAQVILVRWGNLVPWSCATWHDQRIANVECIADLTITWLYHLNSPFCADSTFHCLPEFTVQLESTLTNHSYFGGIILVLHRLMIEAQEAHTLQGPENISFDLAVVLQKSCAAVIQFLRINVETRHPRFEDVVQPICRSLLALFCSLGDKKGDLNAKDLIIEALTLFDTATLRSSFQALRKDPHTQLDAKLNEDIARSSRKLNQVQAVRNDGSPATAFTSTFLVVKCTLCFLALTWYSEAESCIIPQHASSLLSTTMDTLLHGSYNSCEFHAMRDALLTAVAVSGRLCGPGEVCVIEEQIFWDLATRSECTNFIAASSFAHRVMVTEYRSDDLSLAEAWCYLRDVLLLILSRRFAEDDEALALLVCPVLCSAMAKMVQTTSSAVNFILSSPWTMSLCSELRSLIAAEYSPDEQYYSLLQQRLREAGRTFLDQIAQKLQRSTVSIDEHGIDVRQSRLVFCYARTGSRLVLVPQI